MKIFDFFDLNLIKQNQSKFRKIKLLICSMLLIISFTIIGYRTISLASINNENASNKTYAKIENEAAFFGQGHFFQIWEPKIGLNNIESSRKRLLEEKKSLRTILTQQK